MGRTSKALVYPSIKQIIDINRQMIEASGGTFIHPNNLQNGNSLEYTLEFIQHPIAHDFSSVFSIAAFLSYRIIIRHVFFDGNKRTGIQSAYTFLAANGKRIQLERAVIKLAIDVATGKLGESDIESWLISQSP